MSSREVLASRQPDTPLTAWLRAVLWGAFLIPTAAFALAVLWGYEREYQEAVDTVSHASALALAHAQRTYRIAAEIAHRADAASSGTDADVRARESRVHERLVDLVAGLPSIVNVSVWDSQGRPLARSDFYPVDPEATIEDRQYFIDQRESEQTLGISEAIQGRQTGKELLNATIRRQSADGLFAGVVVVSLSPAFFRDYYQSLATEEPNLASFALIRTDGKILTRWPPLSDGRTTVTPGNQVFARMTAGDDAGVVVLKRSDSQTRLVSFRHVAGYPLYISAGVGQAAMLAGWFRFVALVAAVLVPTTLGLVFVSWVALKKTRREQAMSVELQEEIRRRAKAERAMMETQKLEALSQLTGGVAHDFNNLLTIVSTSLHILKRTHPELSEARQVQSMGRAIKSGVRLTRQLLSFSRKQALRPEMVELQLWLPAAEDLVKSTLGRGATLEIQVAPDTCPITVDPGELELALINTAVNARDAMAKGGTLRISARNSAPPGGSDAPMVAIFVQDEGAGISPELLPKVFEPFFTTKGPGKGSGLGLAQVFGLCAQAGGQATVDSVLGAGTTVGMYFPAARAGVTSGQARASAVPGSLEGNVLLVEDNDDVATATENLLRTSGLEVVRVSNADAALARLASRAHPDVVLSDISMPGSMDGIELAFELKKQWPTLSVILSTGYAERIDEAIAAGFRVLPKPVPAEEMLGEIGAVLARNAARPGLEERVE